MSRALFIGVWFLASFFCLRAAAADVQLYGVTYRPAADIAAQYGMKISASGDRTLQLKNQYCVLEFTADKRSVQINGQPMSLGYPIVGNRSGFYISKRDFESSLLPLLSPAAQGGPPSLRRIIIDAGHGGTDPGAEIPSATGKTITNEKIHTLDVALRLALVLQKRGYEVLLIRKEDITIERTKRPLLANRADGDFYLSVHFNKADDRSVSGVETFILTPPWQPSSNRGDLLETDKVVQPGNRFDFWNAIAGFSVQRSVTSRLQATNRGVKRARYDVLTPLNMPGLLVECGFLSNADERAKILTPAYRQAIAESIADGLELYKKTLDRVRPAPPSKPAAKQPSGAK